MCVLLCVFVRTCRDGSYCDGGCGDDRTWKLVTSLLKLDICDLKKKKKKQQVDKDIWMCV